MRNRVLSLVIIVCMPVIVNSQISYENRIEFELKDGYSDEKIFEFGKSGFVISSKNQKNKNNKTEWKYEKYDLNLKPIKTKDVVLNSKLSNDKTFTNKDRIHSMFKDLKGNFSLISIESSNLKATKVDGKIPKKAWIKNMSILGDYAHFNISIKRSPFLFSVNWKTGENKLIPITLENIASKKTTLMNFQFLENSNEIFAYIKVLTNKGKSDIYVIRLNYKGDKEEVFNLTKGIEENIVDVSTSKLEENKYIFTGTYSTKVAGSEGLFFCQTENNKVEFKRFYNFLDLENFLSYLPENTQRKIEIKKERKKKKDKELKINYKIAAHDLIPIDGGYLYLGEAYYPTYRNQIYNTTSIVNGVTKTTTERRQVFDGYKYTHAILSKFDKNGKLIWDEIFEMWPTYKPFAVKRFISIAEKNQNSLKLIFASRNKITSKSIDFDGSVIQDAMSEEIQSNFTGDKIKYGFSNIDFWYDNYFVAYGSQIIKNAEDKENSNKKRKVYFINKIKFN